MKQKIRVTVFEDNCNYDLPTTPKEFIEFWEHKIGLVPAEFAASAEIRVDAEPSYEGSASLDVSVTYRRIETEGEEQTRLAKEKARREYLEEQELCALERLKKKYGV